MSNDLKIPIVVIFMLVATKVLLLMIGRKKSEDTAILALWALSATVTSLTHDLYVVILLLIVIKIFYLMDDMSKNIVAYFALWVAIPSFHLVEFPLPSVPLINATFPRMAMIIWIFPLLPDLLNQARMKGRRVFFDIPVLYLIAMGIVLAFSEHYMYQITIIGSIRETVEMFLDLIIPYFVIVLWADTWEKLKKLLVAFMLSGIALTLFAVFEAVFNWNVFIELTFKNMYPIEDSYNYRAFVRSKTSFHEPLAFGVFLVITLGMALAYMYRDKKHKLAKLLVITFFLAALFVTQSRGNQIAVVLLFILYIFFRMQSASRFILLLLMTLVLSVAGTIYMQKIPTVSNTDLDSVDEHGTFEYRKRLLFTELEMIPDHPFFGNTMYKKDPRMESLRQGEGIIDPVNTYLTLAVEQGLITLFFFIILILRSVKTGLGYVKYGYAINNQVWVNVGAAMTAMILSLSLALAFTSFTGTSNPIWFWFVMGAARAMQLNLEKKREISRAKDEYDFGYT